MKIRRFSVMWYCKYKEPSFFCNISGDERLNFRDGMQICSDDRERARPIQEAGRTYCKSRKKN